MLDLWCCVCFFMQKTAYEMHISDWSSDVCSSDLCSARATGHLSAPAGPRRSRRRGMIVYGDYASPSEFESTGDQTSVGISTNARRARNSVVSGKRWSVRVELGGSRVCKKK